MNDSDRLKVILRDLSGMPLEAITYNCRLGGDLDLDSLDFRELILDIEDEFAIKIPMDEPLLSKSDCELCEVLALINRLSGAGLT